MQESKTAALAASDVYVVMTTAAAPPGTPTPRRQCCKDMLDRCLYLSFQVGRSGDAGGPLTCA